MIGIINCKQCVNSQIVMVK